MTPLWIALAALICLSHGMVSAGIFDTLLSKITGKKSESSDNVMRTSTGPLSPVIILPGDGGSQLQAMLNKSSVLHRICDSKSSGWKNIWADFGMLVPALVDCWVDNLRLVYNNITRKTSDSPGVQIRVPGFGDTDTIEYMTTTKVSSSRYLADIVDRLVNIGYQRGVSVRGAPYDFRKAQNEQGEYFANLKKLTEDTYQLNHNAKVTFIGHSLGCLYLLYFFNRQTDEWKDKYVSSFIAMGGPWGGAVKPIKVIATGDDLDIPIVSRSRLREVLRTNPSVAALLPTDKFWKKNETLISTPDKNYNLGNLREFFDDLNFPEGWEFYQDTKALTYDLVPPGVKVYCLSGTGVNTPKVYLYREGGFPHAIPTVLMEDGDGTVNRRSLDACGLWSTQQKLPVISQTFPGAGHRQMTRDKAVLQYMEDILFPPSVTPTA